MGQGEDFRTVAAKAEGNKGISPANMKMKSAIQGTRAPLSAGIKKHKPAANNVHAMLGNVKSNKFRRPKTTKNTYPNSGEGKEPID